MHPSEYELKAKVALDICYGYLYFMDKEHPLADKKGRVLHHRHVASVYANRWVSNTEVVHHVDHNRSNNDPLNLEIVKDQAEHTRDHQLEKFDKIGRKITKHICVKCKQEFFDLPSRCRSFCSVECASRGTGWPSESAMIDMVWEMPATFIAKSIGVSSSALKKWCKIRDIETPSRGYWSSIE